MGKADDRAVTRRRRGRLGKPTATERRRAFHLARLDNATTPADLITAGGSYLSAALAKLPADQAMRIAQQEADRLVERAEEVLHGRAAA